MAASTQGMTTFNHYALGAVADWMHRVIGGIAPLEPGYSRVLIAPQPGGGITWAQASLRTRHGTVATSWSLEAGKTRLDVNVPDGVTAVVRVPGEPERELTAGRHNLG